ncbi:MULTISPECIES: polysaccharide deacetylase family protein [unclassified Bradyrhizobium]|uniref:polysaccharide deacetylase family protein n=1 Tax=unclassified Bradyrhizobium TaxID=2631580 RepID=UPI0024786638|nr:MULTISPECIES: polysaccharide deacetylase family protein [unclassified Bradyrhizobium]WGS17031.1 polysaccharide deacetylase family protein [Bradyrhizobium sp. ISRA463]WGS30751.1 polysaccharide deacetylase family protein [Bradyrhizobium sp. ISRA464]
MEFAYFSGVRWLRERAAGGAGVILRFERVRPARSGRFQPRKSQEITPGFLDRAISALKRWNYDIVGIDEACRRAVAVPERRRFACLTFDGATKDFITHAYPVLARHGVPFALYLPTAFPDGVGEAWWLALEDIIARQSRISLMIDGRERHFEVRSVSDKHELFDFLFDWMRRLPTSDLSYAIHDLVKRYSVDIGRLSRSASLEWEDLAKLADDPNVTFGSAAVNYPVLSNLKDADARREMAMGKAVAESAFRREIRHFAFPFGDRESFRGPHVVMAQEAGFASAVSTVPGIVEARGRSNLHALPRLSWDGRLRSLRMMRVLLSGVMFAPVQPTRSAQGVIA